MAAPLVLGRGLGLPWRWPRALPTRAGGGWQGYALVAVVLLTVYHAALLAAVWWQGTRDERRPVDAILVLGAAQWNGQPSPVLRARLDHALTLYQEGYAPRVLVTGGVGEGDRYSEALVAAAYLRAQAVPPGAILLEDQGRSSLASLRAAADLLLPHGWSRVLLVSDPPHMLRILRMARAVGLEAYGSPVPDSPAVATREAWLRFMVRELLLLQGYEWGLLRS